MERLKLVNAKIHILGQRVPHVYNTFTKDAALTRDAQSFFTQPRAEGRIFSSKNFSLSTRTSPISGQSSRKVGYRR